jgi:hypothetical protein
VPADTASRQSDDHPALTLSIQPSVEMSPERDEILSPPTLQFSYYRSNFPFRQVKKHDGFFDSEKT